MSTQIDKTESLEAIGFSAPSAAEYTGICLHDSISKEAFCSIDSCTFYIPVFHLLLNLS